MMDGISERGMVRHLRPWVGVPCEGRWQAYPTMTAASLRINGIREIERTYVVDYVVRNALKQVVDERGLTIANFAKKFPEFF